MDGTLIFLWWSICGCASMMIVLTIIEDIYATQDKPVELPTWVLYLIIGFLLVIGPVGMVVAIPGGFVYWLAMLIQEFVRGR